MERSRHEKDARTIAEMVNSFSFSPTKVAKALTNEHRTLQQNFTRFCIAWLEECASSDYRYDARNEASHKLAKDLLDGKELIGLPFI